ncbi:MAG: hypothetical protein V4726_11695 [Verrucomicrobiota bacterium]
MSATNQRNHVIQIAVSDPGRALPQAEDIADDWFATQALAAVLRYSPENLISVVCRKALRRASLCSDAYRRGSVLAWVIRALAERGLHSQAKDVLHMALQEARQSCPVGSRAEALFLLYQAAHPLGGRIVDRLFRELAALPQSDPHWRVSRALVRAGAMHSVIAPDTLQSIIQLIGDPKLTARIERCIGLGLTEPRPFFWQQ